MSADSAAFDKETVEVQAAHGEKSTSKDDNVSANTSSSTASVELEDTTTPLINVYVLSVAEEFKRERQIIFDRVFPKLIMWCHNENRPVRIFPWDLRLGGEKTDVINAYKNDQRRVEQVSPYFLNLMSERTGWIPVSDEFTDEERDELNIDDDCTPFVNRLLSSEQDILHEAYTLDDNPNALFTMQDVSFLDSSDKMVVLNKAIVRKCESLPQVLVYKCKVKKGSKPSDTNLKREIANETEFENAIIEFFKRRLQHEFPLRKETKIDPNKNAEFLHNCFAKNRTGILGRESVVKEIGDYIVSSGQREKDVPLLIVGDAGCGKSSIMAAAACVELNRSIENNNRIVFCHFVGAVPESTGLYNMLRRLLRAFSPNVDIPSDLKELMIVVRQTLSNDNGRAAVVFVDAINQFDATDATEEDMVAWLPTKLAPGISCVLSVIKNSTCKTLITKREPEPVLIEVQDLDRPTRELIVRQLLPERTLADESMKVLMDKPMSHNPLWLTVACEEISAIDDRKILLDYLNNISGTLDGLLEQVLTSLARNRINGRLIEATLCLLEVSRRGLLLSELAGLLADGERHLFKETRRQPQGAPREIIDDIWAGVYRKLKRFLRPFGDMNEGRLDFYHRSVSKAVRRVFLHQEENRSVLPLCCNAYVQWHRNLAKYFRRSLDYDRKVEEYPHHRFHMTQKDGCPCITGQTTTAAAHKTSNKDAKLQRFLKNWEVFDRLYDEEYSGTLLQYWKRAGGYKEIARCYKPALAKLEATAEATAKATAKATANAALVKRKDDTKLVRVVEKYDQVGRLLLQAGFPDEGKKLVEHSYNLITILMKDGSKVYNGKLVYNYAIRAQIELQMLPSYQDPTQIPQVESIIAWHQKAIDILLDDPQTFKGQKYEELLAVQRIKKAFVVAGLVTRLRMRDKHNPQCDELLKSALDDIEKAVVICRKYHNTSRELEACQTEAMLHPRDFGRQHKIYDEARKLGRLIYGRMHHMLIRLHYNEAIVYESEIDATPEDRTRLHGRAYCHFKMAYVLSKVMLGAEHSQTDHFLRTLKESTYKWYADQLKEDVEQLTLEQVEQSMNDSFDHLVTKLDS